MLRGVAFEFRIKAEGWHRSLWNRLFSVGSLVTAFAQGTMLAGYVSGFRDEEKFWLFSAVVSAGLIAGYMLLGSTWIILRSDDALRTKALSWSRKLLPVLLPAITLALGLGLLRTSSRLLLGRGGSDATPFLCAIGIFVCAFAGLSYSIFPYVVIDRLTIWQAASHPSALKFILVGAAVVVPLIVLYTIFVYRIFRGKVSEAGYGGAGH
jgi:cytochrome d ubiquinol oxidase subunit II